MAVTATFLSNCQTQIAASSRKADFDTAYAAFGSASIATRLQQWNLVYSDAQVGHSPAYRLRKFIRETVNAAADADGTMTALDRESAYQTLVAQFAPDNPRPLTTAEESAQLRDAFFEEQTTAN